MWDSHLKQPHLFATTKTAVCAGAWIQTGQVADVGTLHSLWDSAHVYHSLTRESDRIEVRANDPVSFTDDEVEYINSGSHLEVFPGEISLLRTNAISQYSLLSHNRQNSRLSTRTTNSHLNYLCKIGPHRKTLVKSAQRILDQLTHSQTNKDAMDSNPKDTSGPVDRQPEPEPQPRAEPQPQPSMDDSNPLTLRGGCLPCESGDPAYDNCCYCCLGPGGQNP